MRSRMASPSPLVMSLTTTWLRICLARFANLIVDTVSGRALGAGEMLAIRYVLELPPSESCWPTTVKRAQRKCEGPYTHKAQPPVAARCPTHPQKKRELGVAVVDVPRPPRRDVDEGVDDVAQGQERLVDLVRLAQPLARRVRVALPLRASKVDQVEPRLLGVAQLAVHRLQHDHAVGRA